MSSNKQEFSYKCIGVWQNNYRLYHDGKHNEFFVLTPKFRITQSPRRISPELADWCNKKIEEWNEAHKPATTVIIKSEIGHKINNKYHNMFYELEQKLKEGELDAQSDLKD